MPSARLTSFPCAQQRGEHIEARLAFNRIPWPNRVEIQVVGRLLTVTMCLGFVYFGIAEAMRNFDIQLTGSHGRCHLAGDLRRFLLRRFSSWR